MFKNYAGADTVTVGVPQEFTIFTVDGVLTVPVTLNDPVTKSAEPPLVKSVNITVNITDVAVVCAKIAMLSLV